MDLYEIREARLDVISEEAEHQEFSRETTTAEPHNVVSDREGRAVRDVFTFQRFSVNTNESLHFEPCEDGPPSPVEAEDGHDDDDDVFKEGETQVGTQLSTQFIAYSLTKMV